MTVHDPPIEAVKSNSEEETRAEMENRHLENPNCQAAKSDDGEMQAQNQPVFGLIAPICQDGLAFHVDT